ncbi:SOS response-associated peptidase [Acidipila sp. EB88]|uniref:SOS response-associated peptidase n=1 Tax=Acidipila sp. EB88 TaxID=2305226 RepID=UPI000F5FACD2|nr:SOS response-associated peptidase [Acidipila sp. EB88]RRA50468.1 SOS response-associated peptidase [Acidipila sp. EB88]
MCGRYYRAGDKQEIAERFRAEFSDDTLYAAPGYNIAPTTTQPVIRLSRETDRREIVPMRWGLVGHNSSGPDPKRSTFNARSETIEKSPLWRVPFRRRRCLVPLSGFYEWRKPERTAFRFGLKAEPLFALAGLWDAWQNPSDGSWLQSFTIVTTEANELMSAVHDRMPVILRPADYTRWLDREKTTQPPLDLLRPFDSDQMTQALAHPKVGNVRNQGPDMLNSA